jgi:hypothetical protein
MSQFSEAYKEESAKPRQLSDGTIRMFEMRWRLTLR